MVKWKKQGAALVGALSLLDGRPARLVLVGPRDNPKGAVLAVTPPGETAPEIVPLQEVFDLLPPQAIIEALCTQERAYGNSPLDPPEVTS